MRNVNTEYEGYKKLLEKVDGNEKLKSVQKMFTNISPAFGHYQAQGVELQKYSQVEPKSSQNGQWFKKNSENSY